MVEQIKNYRTNNACARWLRFTEEMVEDMSISPSDVVELIHEIKAFISMLEREPDIKRLMKEHENENS